LPVRLKKAVSKAVGTKGDRSSHCYRVMQALMQRGLCDDEVRLVADGAAFADKYTTRGDLDRGDRPCA
jgi:hypothetical protein